MKLPFILTHHHSQTTASWPHLSCPPCPTAPGLHCTCTRTAVNTATVNIPTQPHGKKQTTHFTARYVHGNIVIRKKHERKGIKNMHLNILFEVRNIVKEHPPIPSMYGGFKTGKGLYFGHAYRECTSTIWKLNQCTEEILRNILIPKVRSYLVQQSR